MAINYDRLTARINNIINQIKEIRKDNNELWMDLLKLAFEENPEAASRILVGITENDETVSNLTKKMKNITEEEMDEQKTNTTTSAK